VHAIYGFCRYADDIVDGATGQGDREQALRALGARFRRAWETGEPDHPLVAALIESMRQLGLNTSTVERFLGSMAMDLSVKTYSTWADLSAYMDGSAAVIGEMMLPVLCPGARPRTVLAAQRLGIAFQMTNFLRDVGEDLDRGRVYVPEEDLSRFGADPWQRAVTPQWEALMRFEIDRTRDLYRQARAGADQLEGRAAACVSAAAVLYERILQRIEANRYDVFTTRARVGLPVKLAVVARDLVTHLASVEVWFLRPTGGDQRAATPLQRPR
jgi:phytoene synthase